MGEDRVTFEWDWTAYEQPTGEPEDIVFEIVLNSNDGTVSRTITSALSAQWMEADTDMPDGTIEIAAQELAELGDHWHWRARMIVDGEATASCGASF